MKLLTHPNPQLPRHAWCAVVSRRDQAVDLLCGDSVETREDTFFVGAWNGPFERFDPEATSVFCGTGGRLLGDGVQFAASTDRLSPLFSVRRSERLFVSNSPIFAMTLAGTPPNEAYPFYLHDVIHCWRMGLNCPSGPLPLRSGLRLNVHFSTIMTVDAEGEIRFQAPPAGAAPHDYASYRELLLAGVRGVFENAADPRRRIRYEPLAAISMGYDSSATAALAAQAGCRDSFSFIDSSKPDPRHDSGKDNAERLGMRCREYSRWEHLKDAHAPEVEFALWGTALPTPMAALGRDLENRMLITGHFGDLGWTERSARLIDRFAVSWSNFMSGVGQIEFRLRVGYLNLTPTTIGFQHNRAIADILASEELKAWSVGGDYDRPFARRLAEDAGLPRGSFATRKTGGGHAHFGYQGMTSRSALEDYRRYLAERGTRLPRFVRLGWYAHAVLRRLLWTLLSTETRRLQRWTPRHRYLPFLFHTRPKDVPLEFSYSFQWCYDRLKKRYACPEYPQP